VSPRRISVITEAEAGRLTTKLRDQWAAETTSAAAQAGRLN
jgi:hypothetical protein